MEHLLRFFLFKVLLKYNLIFGIEDNFLNKHCLNQVAKARDVGVNSVVLFPKVPDALKVLIASLPFHLFGAFLFWAGWGWEDFHSIPHNSVS